MDLRINIKIYQIGVTYILSRSLTLKKLKNLDGFSYNEFGIIMQDDNSHPAVN